MKSQLARGLRIASTGLSFALFGVGAVALAVLVFPWVALLSRGEDRRQRRVQRLVHLSFRFFVGFMTALRLIRVSVVGAEKLDDAKGELFVANHPTLLDVVILISLVRQLDCVVKVAALENPFMRGVARAAGYLPNDRGDAMIEACALRLEGGRRVLLFPEGTRSPPNGLGSFQRGAAHVALRSGRPLRPIVIACEPPGLVRGQPWYEVADRPLAYAVEVCDVFDPSRQAAPGAPRGAAARRVTRALRDFYEWKLHHSPGAGAGG